MNEKYIYGTLIAKLMRDKITEQEARQLDEWILRSDENRKLFENLINDYKAAWAKKWFRDAGVSYRGIKWINVDSWYKPEHKNVWDFYIVMAVMFAFLALVYFVLSS